MQPTRLRNLLAIAVVLGAGSYVLFQVVYADLPRLPGYSPVSLGLLALLNGYLALALRSRDASRRVRVAPLVAARYAALAKASSVLAAGFFGAYAGLLMLLATDLDKPAVRSDARVASLGAAISVVLLATALWLEHGCRVPPGPRDDGDGGDSLAG